LAAPRWRYYLRGGVGVVVTQLADSGAVGVHEEDPLARKVGTLIIVLDVSPMGGGKSDSGAVARLAELLDDAAV